MSQYCDHLINSKALARLCKWSVFRCLFVGRGEVLLIRQEVSEIARELCPSISKGDTGRTTILDPGWYLSSGDGELPSSTAILRTGDLAMSAGIWLSHERKTCRLVSGENRLQVIVVGSTEGLVPRVNLRAVSFRTSHSPYRSFDPPQLRKGNSPGAVAQTGARILWRGS